MSKSVTYGLPVKQKKTPGLFYQKRPAFLLSVDRLLRTD